jgi:hypothetical protein
MTDAEFWEVERELWLGGPEAFRRWVPETCLMVFPAPTGILTGTAVVDSVTGAPRWERVVFSGGLVRRTGTEAAVLAYAAQAVRPGGMPYAALCSSCYVRQAGAWWLVQHQQTPG